MSGAKPTPSASARTVSAGSRKRTTTSLSGDVRTLYARTRRRRKAPYKRADVFAHWGGACVYCWGVAEHLDHITPLSRGGRDILSNVVPACAECNLSKGALSLAEWVRSTMAIDSLGTQHNTGENGVRQ